MKQRDTYVDVAKGICMLLIICIHTEVFNVVGMPLTFIAVPMFFFLSGFYDHSERPWSQWIRKSSMTLLLPAFIWCVIGTAFLGLLSFMKSGTIDFNFDINSPCYGNGPAWFLLSLFYTKIIVGVLLRLNLPKYLLVVLCFTVGYLGSEYQMPLNLDEALAAVPLYYFGKILYSLMHAIVNSKWSVTIGSIVLLFFIFTPYYYNIGPSNPLFYPYYLLAIAGAFCVFFLILYISNFGKNIYILQQYGKRTLGIMLTHSLMCHTAAVILNRVFDKGSTVWIASSLVAYILIVLFSYYLTVFVEKYCPLLFGKQR